jgi:hypothetical protein
MEATPNTHMAGSEDKGGRIPANEGPLVAGPGDDRTVRETDVREDWHFLATRDPAFWLKDVDRQ